MESTNDAHVATSDREIVITRTFDAPRQLVFEAWTKPEHVAQWWDPSGAPLSVCEIDLRPNGQFRWVHQSRDDVEHVFSGTYREISAPTRIVFRTRMPGLQAESVGTLVFSEHDGTTTLTIRITCGSVADRDMLLKMRVDAGTTRTLSNLAHYLETIQ
jgi:uncharacterized protein YndB with AHSA1/START domain